MPGSTPTQPGWYDDGDGNQRWFDGEAWTDHVQGPAIDAGDTVVAPSTAEIGVPGGAGAPSGPGGSVPPPAWSGSGAPDQLQVGGGRGLRVAIVTLAVLVVIAGVVVAVIILLGGDDDDAKGTEDESNSSTPSETTQTDESSLEFPTVEDSDFPTESPTDRPTEVPTEIPSLPSDLPTEFPSDFLSDFPTDPAELESWFSDYLEQVKP